MHYRGNTTDTIAAIATPPGIGALGIIRVSGQEAIEQVNAIFPSKDLVRVKSHTLHFGAIRDGEQLLDEVLVSIFRAPHSYTGEDSVEISCHGSPYILQRVMECLIERGIRAAGPGEFTLRAFMNGRMDLSQAEAVADLIASETEAAHRTAMQQMRGGFSERIRGLRQQLLQFAALVELELDFAEEDVEFANRKELSALLHEIDKEIVRLAESFQLGNVIKKGVKVVIAGRPNAGKSTLLNCLLNEERAIVSDIPGTTRDVIEDVITIEGIQFRFIDTAGIRATHDRLEAMGISRTMDKIREAEIIIYLFDVNELDAEALTGDLSDLPEGKKLIIAGNKMDLQQEIALQKKFSQIGEPVFISARDHIGIDELRSRLVETLGLPEKRSSDVLVTNIRHYDALNRALQSIQQSEQAVSSGLTTDLMAFEIRQALNQLAEITGEVTSDEILGAIFSQFCIGK